MVKSKCVDAAQVHQSKFYQKAATLAEKLAEDPEAGLDKVNDAEAKFNKKKYKGHIWDTFRELLAYSKDALTGKYPGRWQARVSALAAIVYTLSPLDLVPDFIPFIGWLDDFAVITTCAHCIRADLSEYRDWKIRRKAEQQLESMVGQTVQQGYAKSSPLADDTILANDESWEALHESGGSDYASCDTKIYSDSHSTEEETP